MGYGNKLYLFYLELKYSLLKEECSFGQALKYLFIDAVEVGAVLHEHHYYINVAHVRRPVDSLPLLLIHRIYLSFMVQK